MMEKHLTRKVHSVLCELFTRKLQMYENAECHVKYSR